MKPFDKEAFLKGAVAISKYGDEVTYLTELQGTYTIYPIVVKCKNPKEEESIDYLTKDFEYNLGDGSYLVGMKLEKRKFYIGVGQNLCEGVVLTSHAYKELNDIAAKNYDKIIEIELEV